MNKVIEGITNLLFIIDDQQLDKVPAQGPLIIVANHINTFDAPVVLSRAYPRPIRTFAKIETFKNPLLGALFKIWGGIPLHRGEGDITAFKMGLQALQNNEILIILPEGTRSHDGALLPAKPGVSILAQRSNAPILPVVYYGGEAWRRNLKQFKRTPFKIVVGSPFRIRANGHRLTSDDRQKLVDEIMYQLAVLLPAQYRGAYTDIGGATEDFLQFDPNVPSNLSFAHHS
ncbi:MAG: lysophospholipid acyltransferase family protein [Anaerolineae bacterium]|nr:lysophospholipid acyltransferase family protein [Anaerolineae bacterium]